ncbi:MAG TPA: pirin family protein [Candidatus Polarisedimenticolaceae bacterium]
MKTVERILTNEGSHWVGDGFPVRTLFSYHRSGPRISPFLLLDHGGPATFPPATTPRGVDEHPHRGFETVTIAYAGEIEHRDSGGHAGTIGPGDVQWMTAASGVVHEEKHSRRFTREGGELEMAQLWVNLPAAHKMSAPRYQTLTSGTIPVVEREGARVRVIAGDFDGTAGAASTVTPVNVWDVRLAPGARLEFDVPAGHHAMFAVLKGTIGVGRDQVRDGHVVLLSDEPARVGIASEAGATVLFLGGEPIHEPIAGYGPFVMNTEQEIRQAIADYQAGRMGHLEPRSA